jgi:hypothetical protein
MLAAPIPIFEATYIFSEHPKFFETAGLELRSLPGDSPGHVGGPFIYLGYAEREAFLP